VFVCLGNPWHFLRDAAPDLRKSVIALGLCLAAMNFSFYMALDRAPLSTVAALELTGTLVVALSSLRSRRNLLAFACAAAGAAQLIELQAAHSMAGIAWALANAGFWVLYLLLGHRVAQSGQASASLGASMAVAALCVLPFGAVRLGAMFSDPLLVLAAFGVAVASSVIPYLCDQQAMKKVSRSHFALMLTLLPGWAVIVGAVMLRQVPSTHEWVGIGLVIAGLSLHRSTQKEELP
jgi:inner membrane transporter RhtA